MFQFKEQEYQQEIGGAKWQENSAWLLDDCLLSIAATSSHSDRTVDLLFSIPFFFSAPVWADSNWIPPLAYEHRYGDQQNCAHAQQLGVRWHWAVLVTFCRFPNRRCARLCLVEDTFEWWAKEWPHPFFRQPGNNLFLGCSHKRRSQKPTRHGQLFLPCCTADTKDA